MITVLVTGKVARDPETKVAKSGVTYCTTLVSIPNGGDQIMARVTGFDPQVVAKLQCIHKGDPVSVAGVGELSVWVPEGRDPRVNLNINASSVMSPYDVRKRQKKAEEASPYVLSDRAVQAMKTAGDMARQSDVQGLKDDIPW